MRVLRGSAAAPLIGVGFGAATSLSNDLSSDYGRLGSHLTGSSWQPVFRFLSLLLDAGWAWAALAVAVGWLAGTSVRGAVAGVLALVAATTNYYALDSVLRQEPFSGYEGELELWLMAGLVLGSALGVVGASARRPGVIGVLAKLTVPVGAALQMTLLPPRPRRGARTRPTGRVGSSGSQPRWPSSSFLPAPRGDAFSEVGRRIPHDPRAVADGRAQRARPARVR